MIDSLIELLSEDLVDLAYYHPNAETFPV